MPKVAFVVHPARLDAPLSPFFGKAQGLVILDPALPERTYLPNEGWNADWVCVTLLANGVRQLICSYIDGRSMRRLDWAGIDVRLAPCSRPAVSLVDQFQRLRTAAGGRADPRSPRSTECRSKDTTNEIQAICERVVGKPPFQWAGGAPYVAKP